MSTSSPNLAAPSRHLTYLDQFLGQRLPLAIDGLDRTLYAWVEELRDRALLSLHEKSLPTTRYKEWRFTDLSPLQELKFQPIQSAPAQIQRPDTSDTHYSLTFVNGVQTGASAELPDGMFLGNLSALLTHPYLSEKIRPLLAQQSDLEEEFTALNTAGFQDVALLWVSQDTAIAQPIHLSFISSAGVTPSFSQPRCLIVAESGSKVTLVEEYIGAGEGVYFTNNVTEIRVGAYAQVEHTRVQRDHDSAFHIGRTAVSQERDSRYTCNAISLGARLSRHNLDIYQKGEQTQTTLNGLTVVDGEQLADTHSSIVYSKPYGRSRQLHKCVVDDQARAVFNGKVFVPKAAQLTDAGQLNRNLLLSNKARVDTQPELEIVADNVKCTHGATVSQLDAEEVFYLQSRGLDPSTAQKLLLSGFAIEIINQIPVASLQTKLTQFIQAKVF